MGRNDLFSKALLPSVSRSRYLLDTLGRSALLNRSLRPISSSYMLDLMSPLVNTRAFCLWTMMGEYLFGRNISIFSSGINHTFSIIHFDVDGVYYSYCKND